MDEAKLDNCDLSGAKYGCDTCFPDDFDPEQHGMTMETW